MDTHMEIDLHPLPTGGKAWEGGIAPFAFFLYSMVEMARFRGLFDAKFCFSSWLKQ